MKQGPTLSPEHDNQTIADAIKSSFSRNIPHNEVHLLVAGENCADAVADAANIDGVAKALKADDAAFAKLLAEPLADLVVSLADGYMITAATTNGKTSCRALLHFWICLSLTSPQLLTRTHLSVHLCG